MVQLSVLECMQAPGDDLRPFLNFPSFSFLTSLSGHGAVAVKRWCMTVRDFIFLENLTIDVSSKYLHILLLYF